MYKVNQAFTMSRAPLLLSTSEKHYENGVELTSEPTLTVLAFDTREMALAAKTSIEASKVPGLIVTALFKE